MGYPSDLLSSRAVVKPGMYAIIPPEGRVFNVIPGIEGCRMTILCTPKMGAGFVQHIGTALPGGGTTMPYGASGLIETFIYVLDGEGSLTVTVGGRTEVMPQGGYAYAPAGVGISFRNETDKPLRFLLYKQRYIPHPDPAMQPYAVFGNTNDIEERIYDNMENVFVRDLLPVDERFDMNMHILSFAPRRLPSLRGNARAGARRVPVRRGGPVPAERRLGSGQGRRLHLDGRVLQAVLLRRGPHPPFLHLLQGLPPRRGDLMPEARRVSGGGPPPPQHRRHTMERYHDHFRKPQAAGPS